ncbi:PREDICTED: nose resistant to fluoxetine protein 6-like [Nanorana parkeri]|uniref:nose resistant to fluoxetine protein 6-like n=1 Tax=Nanorana parkeri TaxID=125878 RepID=UPI0008542C89|nr:PREDICTED: nose resistant to fluoxetine protein 6-like [Nanorana parkeri]
MVARTLLVILTLVLGIAAAAANVTYSCFKDTMSYLSDLNGDVPKAYAMMMYDALGKPGSSLLTGNVDRLGSFSECLSVEDPQGNFKGEYCKLHVEQEGIKFVIGICVPDSCSSQEITSLASIGLFRYKSTPFLAPLPSFIIQNETAVTMANTVCSRGLFPANTFAIICLFLSGLLIILPIIGSVYTAVLYFRGSSPFSQCQSIIPHRKPRAPDQDKPAIKSASPPEEDYSNKKTPTCLGHVLKSFSLQENIQSVMTVTSQEYPTLNGIRVLSLLWIISGHTSQLASVFNIDNSFEWKSRVLEKPMYFYTLSGPVYLGVDSFFFLSGFLGAKTFLKMTEDSGKEVTLTMVTRYILKRLKRIQPLHLASIPLSIALISLVQWGVFWELPKHQWDNCNRVWWANVLLITNFVSVSDSCTGWAWYLSNDFQFHLTTPLLIFLYVKVKYIMFAGVALMFIASTVTTTVMSFLLKLPIRYPRGERVKYIMFAGVALMFIASTVTTTVMSFLLKLPIRYPRGESQSRMNYWVEYYTKPYCRYGPFLVGVVTGLMIAKKQYIRSKAQAVAGWLSALLIVLLVICLAFLLDDTPTSYSILAAIYQGSHRTLWAAAIAMILVLCHEGYGGPLNTMLSCGIWNVLSKVSYACYLAHPIIIIFYCGMQETLFHYQDINMFYLFIGHSMLTIAIGLALTVLLERPFQRLLCT